MGRNLNSGIIACFLAVILIFFFACTNDKKTSASQPEQEPQQSKKSDKSIASPILNGAIVFVDKSSSIQKVPFEESDKICEQIFSRLADFLQDTGGQVAIYFIHKDLASASPFFETTLVKPNTKGMTAFPAATKRNQFKKEIESLKTNLREAISAPVKQATRDETDIWISLKKVNDRWIALPKNGKKAIIYYSDMVESVSDKNCGKNYQNIQFKNVSQAEDAAKSDVKSISDCLRVKQLPVNTSVFLFLPTGANSSSSHPFLVDYWKILFREFGAQAVESNL